MTLFGFSEISIRFGVFIAILLAMAIYELYSPRLERDEMRGALKTERWITNLSMVILSSICLRVIFPAAAVGIAFWAEQNGLGLFNLIEVPNILICVICFVVLDFAIWLEHVASHKIPVLWRIHRMHHADNGFDVTTALRFHPLEIVLSMAWKMVIIVALGAPAIAVLIFEVVLNGMAMFNHSNIKLPLWLDRIMRPIFVTPDMHRVHHSSDHNETDSNYGFNFAFWDRLFSTYVAQPKSGHDDMEIGLKEYRGRYSSQILWTLLLPFKKLYKAK